MKEQILDRLARLLKYFKGLEHENNEKEYAYILKGTINGITYSIDEIRDIIEEAYLEDDCNMGIVSSTYLKLFFSL